MFGRSLKSGIRALLRRLGYEILREERYAGLLAARAAAPAARSTFEHSEIEQDGRPMLADSARVLPTRRELEFCERLITAYSRSIRDLQAAPAAGPDIWTYSASTIHRPFIRLLEAGSVEDVALQLCNMHSQAIAHGLSVGDEGYRVMKLSQEAGGHYARRVLDSLLTLNEAIGTVSIENPEQGAWGLSANLDADDLIDRANQFFGFSIVPALCDGEQLGLGTAHGILGLRDLFSLYLGFRLKTLADLHGLSRQPICEIGSGIGRLLHYLGKFGFTRIWSYDLPYVQVLAAFETMKSLGGDRVALYGESREDAVAVFMPAFRFGNADDERFAITVNQDSMPEIDEAVVMHYLSAIKSVTSNFFVSVNHESRPPGHHGFTQHSVSNLVARVGGFSRVKRDRFWLRKGYVEEVYSVVR